MGAQDHTGHNSAELPRRVSGGGSGPYWTQFGRASSEGKWWGLRTILDTVQQSFLRASTVGTQDYTRHSATQLPRRVSSRGSGPFSTQCHTAASQRKHSWGSGPYSTQYGKASSEGKRQGAQDHTRHGASQLLQRVST